MSDLEHRFNQLWLELLLAPKPELFTLPPGTQIIPPKREDTAEQVEIRLVYVRQEEGQAE